MCGIAGMVGVDPLGADDSTRVVRMRDVIAHRGPDDAGLFVDDRAILAHRRLSIVDLAAGHQPLSNEDGSVWVVFNGEIYNHGDLRPLLEEAGHVYRTRSDTETIVHAYEEWGDACVERFRGMFAFALWDRRRERLLLVRDRLGIKPLYWARAGSRLLFGSEIKSILESGLVEARANERAIPELLATRTVAGDGTMFRGVQKLLPGHLMTVSRGEVTTRQYWDIPAGERFAGEPRRFDEDVERFRALFEESIRLRLMSDVPLGVFLSGGIDSSAIAALMARMIDRPLQTFSVAFADRACNELAYSRLVAQSIGADVHEVVIDDRTFFEAIPRLVWHEDEPIAHPSSVPLFFVSKLASQHVKVVLTGEGSDELLAGYGRYPRALLNWHAGSTYERVAPAPVRARVAQMVPHVPGRLGSYLSRSFLAVDRAPDLVFFDTFAAIPIAKQRALLAHDGIRSLARDEVYGPSLQHFDSLSEGGVLDRLLYADLKTYLVELLMKQDQMSMAASIESRVPFLDHHLVEFAARLPADRKLVRFNTKRILRAAVKDVLPPQILDRSKMGFPVPFAAWLGQGWSGVVRDVLLDRRARERGIFDSPAVERLLEPGAASTHAAALWSLFNLELWYRTFIDGDGIQTLPSFSRALAPPLGTNSAVEPVAAESRH